MGKASRRKHDKHSTALFTVEAFQMTDKWEASPASEAEKQITEEIVVAVAADDVHALKQAVQQLPALCVSLFDITILINDVPDDKPVSLLRLAQKLKCRNAWAFIVGEGLAVGDAECIAAMNQGVDGAAASSSQENTLRWTD